MLSCKRLNNLQGGKSVYITPLANTTELFLNTPCFHRLDKVMKLIVFQVSIISSLNIQLSWEGAHRLITTLEGIVEDVSLTLFYSCSKY